MSRMNLLLEVKSRQSWELIRSSLWWIRSESLQFKPGKELSEGKERDFLIIFTKLIKAHMPRNIILRMLFLPSEHKKIRNKLWYRQVFEK